MQTNECLRLIKRERGGGGKWKKRTQADTDSDTDLDSDTDSGYKERVVTMLHYELKGSWTFPRWLSKYEDNISLILVYGPSFRGQVGLELTADWGSLAGGSSSSSSSYNIIQSRVFSRSW